MKKYNVTVTRTDEYIVEIDETIYNEEWMKDFERYFHPLDGDMKEIAIDLATHQARFGSDVSGGFIEGYGYISRDGKLPFSFEDYDEKGKELPEDKKREAAPGLNIRIISEDDDIETDVEEVMDEETNEQEDHI